MKRDRPLCGVIGGVGTTATLDFFQRVVAATRAEREQDHVPLIIFNNSDTPDRNLSILNGDATCGRVLADVAQRLEAAGSQYLVLPCNAAHYYADTIASAVSVPLLDMVAETCAVAAAEECGGPVGVLCADGTRHAGLYTRSLRAVGLDAVELEDREQQVCMRCIYAAKANRVDEAICDEVAELVERLANRGAKQIIAACTEIPMLLKDRMLTVPVVNSSDVLARACVNIAGGVRALPIQESPSIQQA